MSIKAPINTHRTPIAQRNGATRRGRGGSGGEVTDPRRPPGWTWDTGGERCTNDAAGALCEQTLRAIRQPEAAVGTCLTTRVVHQESLALLTAEAAQQGVLPRGFNAFGDNAEPQGPREGDNAANDGLVLPVGTRTADERAVDLQNVDREVLEVAQRGVARTEIVDGQPHAKCFEPTQRLE